MLFAEKIGTAKIPESFTHAFLQNAIGLKGTGDRPLIPFLRSLGFIDTSGKPTIEYSKLKGSEQQRRIAVGEGIKKAYRPLFDADEQAYTHTGQDLRNLIAQVAGTNEDVTARIGSRDKSALMTLPQLLKVIDEKWKEGFDDLIRDKGLIQEARLLVHLRNTICHMSTIPVEEVDRIKQTMRDWFRVVAP